MAHLERIYHQPPTLWGRLAQTLRSLTLGPISIKDPRLREVFGWGTPTASGVPVSEATALNYAAVWQAVTLIAGDVGSLPLFLYKRDKDGGKTRFTEHPLYELLHTSPNPEMSSMTVRETLQAHALTWGNGFAEVERDAAARPIALWPLLPTHVQPYRDEQARLKYQVRNPNGSDVVIDAANMLHIHGLGFDGTAGYSVIRQARESLGLLAAAEKFGATFFGNGSTFGGTLVHPKNLGAEGVKNLRESVEKYGQGADKAHRFLVLEEGIQYTKFGVEPNDAQFLETRQFQIAEVARWFNLPLHKLREMEHSSVRANIEQEALDYYVATLRPWLARWEMELNRKLVSARERYIQHIEFNLDGVLRGDMKSRYDSYAIGRKWGWLNVNEIRALENMGPVTDGDKYLSPLNMVPANRIDEVIDKQVEPAPTPVTAPAASEPDADERADLIQSLEAQAATIGMLQERAERLAGDLDVERAAKDAVSANVVVLADWKVRGEKAEAEVGDLSSVRDALRAALDAEKQASEDARVSHVAEIEAERARVAAEAEARATAESKADRLEVERQRLATEAEQRAATAQALEADLIMAAGVREEALAIALMKAQDDAATLAQARLDAETRAEASETAMRNALTAAQEAQETLQRAQTEAEAGSAASANQIEALTAERDQALRDVATLAELRTAAETAQTEALRLDALAKEAVAEATRALADASAARNEAKAAKDASATLLVNVSTSARAVVVDMVARLVRRETEKAHRARATPEKLRAWAATFYEAHEAETWVETLRPVVALHQALVGSARDADAVARELVAAHFETSLRQILAAAAVEPDEFDGAVTTTLTRWESVRAADVADAFVKQEMAHVRTIQ